MTAATDRFTWVSSFADSWIEAAEGQAIHEHLIEVGEALYPVLKARPPEEVAREHYQNSLKPELPHKPAPQAWPASEEDVPF